MAPFVVRDKVMIKLAVIGTNWITGQFVDAAIKTGEYQLSAVYSRSKEKAEEFAKAYGTVELFDDLTQFAKSDAFDAVYIASLIHCMRHKQCR